MGEGRGEGDAGADDGGDGVAATGAIGAHTSMDTLCGLTVGIGDAGGSCKHNTRMQGKAQTRAMAAAAPGTGTGG